MRNIIDNILKACDFVWDKLNDMIDFILEGFIDD
jgi:hypothetical protein